MKYLCSFLLALFSSLGLSAQGWPSAYEGVMLQGFYWDSFVDSRWSNLEKQSSELSRYFNLIWVPQSGNCNTGHNNMGYTPVYLFDHNSSFGTEAQLRSMIAAFKAKGTGVIADVVINHRNNLGVGGSWVDYPAETYGGKTYQMTATDICANDDGGQTAAWATKQGLSLSPNADTGDDWSGCRDIDHKSENVRATYKDYLRFLLSDLGYTGFRYDMVKGYAPNFIAEYNTAAQPTFSVGEYWDGSSAIRSWIDRTKQGGVPTSAAFDFPFRYSVRDAVNTGNWAALNGAGQHPLINNADYRRYAVTFVENHDTQYRSATDQLDPIRRDTLAANAFMLALPGTPCVFYRHWLDHKQALKAMIDVRRAAGITNTSDFINFASATDHYAVRTIGTRGQLVCVVGSRPDKYVPNASFVRVLSGKGYTFYLSRSAATAWVDAASGEYDAAFAVRAVAAAPAGTELVYTLDGSTPTAASAKVGVDGQIAINASCTLRVGLLVGGAVSGIVERDYVIRPFAPYKATVYVRNENAWSTTNFYLWDSKGGTQLNGNWPGRTITATRHIDGHDWHYQTVDITAKDYYFNLVVNSGTGTPQTVDIPQISSDRYFVISTAQVGGKYTVTDVTSTLTGIAPLRPDASVSTDARAMNYYDLSGRRVFSPQRGRLYINGLGRKVMF